MRLRNTLLATVKSPPARIPPSDCKARANTSPLKPAEALNEVSGEPAGSFTDCWSTMVRSAVLGKPSDAAGEALDKVRPMVRGGSTERLVLMTTAKVLLT